MIKKFATIVLIMFTAIHLQAQTETDSAAKKEHVFSRTLVLSAEGGVSLSFTDFNKSKKALIYRGSLEYFFPSKSFGAFGLRFWGGGGNLEGEGGYANSPSSDKFKTKVVFVGGGLVYALSLSKVIYPYFSVGATYLTFEPSPDIADAGHIAPSTIDKKAINLTGEFGTRFMLSDHFSLNLAAQIYLNNNDYLDGLDKSGKANDMFYGVTAGFSIFMNVPGRDSDGDGISDSKDLCPDNPPGVEVDEFGCPVDTDKDGVANYIDKCPNTPANVLVDKDGCPYDNDYDSVPDYLDRCPQTPEGVEVDIHGCPIDSDLDGVADYLDNCPDTEFGVEIDEFGCEVKKDTVQAGHTLQKIVLSGKAVFETGKDELTENSKQQLFKLIEYMNIYPESKWLVEGHTDNVGPRATNVRLSLQRANAVVNYFVSNGVEASRFITRGLGPDFPIGDNTTASGRAENRRFSIEFIDQQKFEELSLEGVETYEPVDVPETTTSTEGQTYDDTKDRYVINDIYTDGTFYCVQISSWQSMKKAQSEVQKLIDDGQNAYVMEKYIESKESTWYRVRVGYFDTLEDAQAFQNR